MNQNKITQIIIQKYSICLSVLLIVSGLCNNRATAQSDPVFTQYMTSIQTVNPAYTGMWDRKGFQVFSRYYYVGLTGPQAKSMLLYSPFKNANNGIGLDISEDRFGYEKRTTFAFDYAYQVRLNWKTELRLGLKAGFINYDNSLTEYNLSPGESNDPAFSEDIHIRMMPTWGVGAFLYSRNYYISLSVPRVMKNDFQANENNYSSEAEIRYAYLMGGIIFSPNYKIKFKPTIMLKSSFSAELQADLSVNWLFYEKFWAGFLYRTNKTAAFITQFTIHKNLKFGYAIEFPLAREISKYQWGTHEFRISYDIDFFKRPYARPHYF